MIGTVTGALWAIFCLRSSAWARWALVAAETLRT